MIPIQSLHNIFPYSLLTPVILGLNALAGTSEPIHIKLMNLQGM